MDIAFVKTNLQKNGETIMDFKKLLVASSLLATLVGCSSSQRHPSSELQDQKTSLTLPHKSARGPSSIKNNGEEKENAPEEEISSKLRTPISGPSK